jgi:alpha-1,3-rhamnosyl/mannosyltransferase
MCLPAVLDLTTFMVPQFHTKRNRYTERILVPRTLSRWPTITCTRTTALDIARMFPNAKAFVVSPTVSLKHSKPPSPTIEGPPYVIAVGTLEPRKNLLVPIEAVRMMRRAGEDVKLILVGMRGWHFDALRTPLEAAISEGAVEWLGYVSDERRDELYDGASALLFPSHYEGFGLPLLEAMARGLPAITSQAPALVEVGRDGAMHVPTDDPAAWAGAIRRITQDKPLRAALAARGLELASAFTSSRTGAELGHAVRTLLG